MSTSSSILGEVTNLELGQAQVLTKSAKLSDPHYPEVVITAHECLRTSLGVGCLKIQPLQGSLRKYTSILSLSGLTSAFPGGIV